MGKIMELSTKYRINHRAKYYCVMCTSQHCNHIEFFIGWIKENNTEENFTEGVYPESNDKEPGINPIKSITNNKIPYPLPENPRLLHSAYEAGLKTFCFLCMTLSKLVFMEILIAVKILIQLAGLFLMM